MTLDAIMNGIQDLLKMAAIAKQDIEEAEVEESSEKLSLGLAERCEIGNKTLNLIFNVINHIILF